MGGDWEVIIESLVCVVGGSHVRPMYFMCFKFITARSLVKLALVMVFSIPKLWEESSFQDCWRWFE